MYIRALTGSPVQLLPYYVSTMLIDNEKDHIRLHAWMAKHVHEGKMDLVTGYFTVGGLAFLGREVLVLSRTPKPLD